MTKFQRGDRLYTSESDVYRRQSLTYKDGPRAESVNNYILSHSCHVAKTHLYNSSILVNQFSLFSLTFSTVPGLLIIFNLVAILGIVTFNDINEKLVARPISTVFFLFVTGPCLLDKENVQKIYFSIILHIRLIVGYFLFSY